MASKLFPAILIAVVIWLGAQVWRDSGKELSKASEPQEAQSALVPSSARPRALDFTLQSAQGEQVQLASFQGKSPVVLNFFATW